MAREAYVSIVGLDLNPIPVFEKLKTGAKSQIGDRCLRVTGGIPPSARLTRVIYVYEDESLPEVANPFDHAPVAIRMEGFDFSLEMRNLSAVVHNLCWRLEPGAASPCKIASKLHDVKRALEDCAPPTESAPEALHKLYNAALAASASKTISELLTHREALKEARDAVEAL